MIIKQKQNFDKESQIYDDMLKKSIKNTGFSFGYIQEYKVIDFENELIKMNNKPKRILDFGCGIGLSVEYLRKHFPDSEIFCCDYSKKSIEKCIERNQNIKNLYIKETDGINIPFKEKFDAIYIANVIRHIPRENQDIILKNLYNSLSDKGLIMMYEFNPFNPVSLYFYFKEDRHYDSDNVKIMTSIYSKKIFSNAGFKNIKINYRFFIPNNFKNLLWIEKYLKKCPIGANYYLTAVK